MDTFYSSTSLNFTLDETESFDEISLKFNRSKLLLSEMTSESKSSIKPPTYGLTSKKPQSILKPNALSHQADIYLSEFIF